MHGLTIELIPDPEEGGFTAHVPDIPAYGEGATKEEAIADLQEAIAAYIDAFGVDEAMNRLNPPSELRKLDCDLVGFAHG
jgi:predicted RNase H-like HicB family nuclease